jgi:hypothetical protein
MARNKLRDELVEDPDGKGGYYKTDVQLTDGTALQGNAMVPGHGRVIVEKEIHTSPQEHVSFAWKVKK